MTGRPNAVNLTSLSKELVKQLNAKDSNCNDKMIDANIWNDFASKVGGKNVKYGITFENAEKSIRAYATKNSNNATNIVKKWINGDYSENTTPSSNVNNTEQAPTDRQTEHIANTNADNLSSLSQQFAEQLDIADGKKDGYIKSTVWNDFASKVGGKNVNCGITINNAANSIGTYAKRTAESDAKKQILEWLNIDFSTPNTTPKAKTPKSTTEPVGKATNVTPRNNVSTLYRAILNGTYKNDYVEINGVRHFHYDDANANDLVLVNGHRIHKDAARAFEKMRAAALKDNCNLYIVSGTRDTKYQVSVFKKKFKDKNNPTESELNSRIVWSAPSGYSEHHTGYAIDINSTSTDFANTKEYKWLQEHAKEYGFEISFPKNNKQHVGFEPWHWRYVGTEEAAHTFAKAREFANS